MRRLERDSRSTTPRRAAVGARAWILAAGLGAACLLPACGRAQESTAEQRLFDWTRPRFSRAVYAGRCRALAERLRASGGGIFLTPSARGRSAGGTFRQLDDFEYLCGLELPDALLAVDAAEGRVHLFVPARDARFESASRPNDFPGRPLGDDPELARVSGIESIHPVGELASAVGAWVAEGRAVRLDLGRQGADSGGELDLLAVHGPVEALARNLRERLPEVRIVNAFEDVARLRMVKSPEELEVLRRACAITSAGIREAAGFVCVGVDERGLEAELEAAFKRRGAQRLAFASIIKSGPNSLWPWRILAAHYDRRNRKMRAGELVIFDVGCELDHYASDVGRTFPVSGRFSTEQERLLRMATAVSDAIVAAVRPGITLAELQVVAVAAIPADERRHMQTGLFFGHHVGLDVGDPSVADVPLEPGMVFTVEPWYYDHEGGVAVGVAAPGRLDQEHRFVEDVIVVTAEGAESLTADLPRDPRGLEALVKGGR
jgi:Xaa-Pro aminopeptidase